MKIRLLLLIGVLSPLAAAIAQTEDRPPGRVAARAFATAPAPLSLEIAPGDNTDENMALAQRIAKEAKGRGITVGSGSTATILRFDSEVRTSSPAPRQSYSRQGGGSANPDSSTPRPPGSPDEVANMLSSSGAGILSQRQPSGSDYERPLRYVINATLEDRATGRTLWQGHVSYDTTAHNRTAQFVALAPVLVEQIGKNLQEKPFRLD
jgi:hypothetical protein